MPPVFSTAPFVAATLFAVTHATGEQVRPECEAAPVPEVEVGAALSPPPDPTTASVVLVLVPVGVLVGVQVGPAAARLPHMLTLVSRPFQLWMEVSTSSG